MPRSGEPRSFAVIPPHRSGSHHGVREKLTGWVDPTLGRQKWLASRASHSQTPPLESTVRLRGNRRRDRLADGISLETLSNPDGRTVWSSCGCGITNQSTMRLSDFVSWSSTPVSREKCDDASSTRSQARPAAVSEFALLDVPRFNGWLAVLPAPPDLPAISLIQRLI